jgi:hypothetical protein
MPLGKPRPGTPAARGFVMACIGIGAAWLPMLGCGDGSLASDSTSATGGGPSGSPVPYEPGPPGCGLDAAAFCDPFDAPAPEAGRSRELDARRWSGGRMATPGLPSANGEAVGIGHATLPACRAGLPATVLTDRDTLICDGIDTIHSNHLLVATAAQNYGQNSYRIRQPFDFEGRTGKIVFDAQGYAVALQGWTSIAVTEEPTAAPSYLKQQNEENGALPNKALEIHFLTNCQMPEPAVGISYIIVFDDLRQTILEPENPHCVPTRNGALNRFEIALSRERVEVYATPVSEDGINYAPLELLAAADIDLPFSRGYVHINTHNHATLKYSDDTVDAWISRWDNVGFDGPVIEGKRESEIPDSLVPGEPGRVSVGYIVADQSEGPRQRLRFSDVDTSGVKSARIAATAWFHLDWGDPLQYALRYRLNGSAWKRYELSESQLRMIDELPASGTLALMLDVDPAELQNGDNTLELVTVDVPISYPPMVLNIDLALETE